MAGFLSLQKRQDAFFIVIAQRGRRDARDVRGFLNGVRHLQALLSKLDITLYISIRFFARFVNVFVENSCAKISEKQKERPASCVNSRKAFGYRLKLKTQV